MVIKIAETAFQTELRLHNIHDISTADHHRDRFQIAVSARVDAAIADAVNAEESVTRALVAEWSLSRAGSANVIQGWDLSLEEVGILLVALYPVDELLELIAAVGRLVIEIALLLEHLLRSKCVLERDLMLLLQQLLPAKRWHGVSELTAAICV